MKILKEKGHLPLRLAPVRCLVRPPRPAGAERRSPAGRHVPDCRGQRLAAATLQVHLAAIVTAHRLVGLSLDPGHPSIALPMDGIRRRRGPAQPPGDADYARDAGPNVRAQPATPLGLRNRAILLAGFGGALRRSEIVGPRSATSSCRRQRRRADRPRSKTDQHGAGQAVAIWRSDDPDPCAPTALRRWLDHRAARHADDPLFVGLRAGGVMTAARLSDKAVVRLVKDTAEAVGDGDPGLMEEPSAISRSASSAPTRATACAPVSPPRPPRPRPAPRRHATDRHKSVEAARRYMRSADLWRNNVTEKVMRHRPEGGGSGEAAKTKLRSQREKTHL